MTRWQTIRLVAAREVRERTRTRMFRFGTAITVLIVCAGIVLPGLLSDDGQPTATVALAAPSSPEVRQAIERLGPSVGAKVTTTQVPDVDSGERLIRDGAADVLLVPGNEVVTKVPVQPGSTSRTSQLAAAVDDVARVYAGLQSQGLSLEQASEALAAPPLPLRGLDPVPAEKAKDMGAAAASMILLFLFLTLYGAWILNGVVEEKTSRVVEVLLSAVRPADLLTGKVIGIGIVGSVQGVALAAAAFIARSAAGNGSGGASLRPMVIAATLLWFALGFAIYSWMYACAGALVSRSEDAQNLVFPLQLPLIASYVAGIGAAAGGMNPVITTMSFLPPTAPMAMLVRMAAGDAPWWQVVVSAAMCALTAWIVMRLAVVVFAGGILRSGQRVKLREAWRTSP